MKRQGGWLDVCGTAAVSVAVVTTLALPEVGRAQASKTTWAYVSLKGSVLRQRPNAFSRPVATLKRCERVRVLAARPTGRWIRVRARLKTVGYIDQRVLVRSERLCLQPKGRPLAKVPAGKAPPPAPPPAASSPSPAAIQSSKSGAIRHKAGCSQDYADFFRPPSAPGHYFVRRNACGAEELGMIWGRKALVDLLLAVSDAWAKKNPDHPFGVGDISAEGGSQVWKHGSHNCGLDMDVFLFQQRLAIGPGKGYGSKVGAGHPDYDPDLTRQLIQTFADVARASQVEIEVIFYNDNNVNKQIQGIKVQTDREAGNSRTTFTPITSTCA